MGQMLLSGLISLKPISIKFDEDAVKATLLELNSKGMINQKHGSSMNLNLDAFIWVNDALYIARPLITRYWLQTGYKEMR